MKPSLSKKSRKEKPTQMAKSAPNKGAVHRLYEQAGHCNFGQTVQHEELQQSRTHGTNHVPINAIGNLLGSMKQRSEEDTFKPRYGRSFSFKRTSSWVKVGCYIQGNSFKLQVINQHNTPTNDRSGRVRQVDPTPCMKELNNNLFEEIEENSGANLMFQIEIERSEETTCSSNDLNLQLTLSTEVDPNMNYLILQQEAGTTQWRDITDECKTTKGSPNIEIPVKKSSKIWVIRSLKKFSDRIKHALVALVHGKVLFHILIYYLKKAAGKIKVRIIGMSDELYQNRHGIKTAINVAEELKFIKGEECFGKQLLRKGNLKVEVHRRGECLAIKEFDIERKTINKNAEWYDYNFDVNDLKDDLKVKVIDKDGNVSWCIDLNEMLSDEVEKPVEQAVNISKPEITSFDDEVCEDHIPWLARHLSKDVDKVAMLLHVDSVEIEAIKQREQHPETANIKILDSWRKKALCCGTTPTWQTIKDVLENENVRRFDVIRALLNENEIDNNVLLWLEPRVAAFSEMFARVLEVPDYEVDMLSRSFERREETSTALLQRWRQRTRTPKIEHLIRALEHDTLQKGELAKEMREKFCRR